MSFKKATKTMSKARIGLVGPAGSGKTYTALLIAHMLAPNGKIALIDSEHGSASKYAGEKDEKTGIVFNFDTVELTSFDPRNYIKYIHEAEKLGYDVIVADGISQAWQGKDGVLEQVDNVTSRSKSGNAYTTGWREMTPVHNEFIDTMVACKAHFIATLRSKMEYVIEEINGKKVPRKIGMAPIQREGMDFEFDVVGELDWENTLQVSKTRCKAINKKRFHEPGIEFIQPIIDWLNNGAKLPDPVDESQIIKFNTLIDNSKLPDKTKKQLFTKFKSEANADNFNEIYSLTKAFIDGKQTDKSEPSNGRILTDAEYMKMVEDAGSLGKEMSHLLEYSKKYYQKELNKITLDQANKMLADFEKEAMPAPASKEEELGF